METLDDRSEETSRDLVEARETLDRLPPVERVRRAMEYASFYLEYAAFEMALDEGADDVSEIILMAAKLDMAAKRIDENALQRLGSRPIRKI